MRTCRSAGALLIGLTLVATACTPGEEGRMAAEKRRPEAAAEATPPTPSLPKHVEAQIRVGNGPDGLAVGFGSVWVANQHGGSVWRIDPETNQVIAKIRSPHTEAARLVAGYGAVWVNVFASNKVLKIDPKTNDREVLEIGPGEMDCEPAAAFGSIWTGHYTGRRSYIARIDPKTNKIEQRVPNSGCVGAGFGSLWVSTPDAREIRRIDPETGAVIETLRGVGALFDEDAAAFGSIWGVSEDQVVRIDPKTNTVVALGPKDNAGVFYGQPALTTDKNAVWVSDGVRTMYRLDPETNRLKRWGEAPPSSLDAISGFGSLWFSSFSGNQVWRYMP